MDRYGRQDLPQDSRGEGRVVGEPAGGRGCVYEYSSSSCFHVTSLVRYKLSRRLILFCKFALLCFMLHGVRACEFGRFADQVHQPGQVRRFFSVAETIGIGGEAEGLGGRPRICFTFVLGGGMPSLCMTSWRRACSVECLGKTITLLEFSQGKLMKFLFGHYI